MRAGSVGAAEPAACVGPASRIGAGRCGRPVPPAGSSAAVQAVAGRTNTAAEPPGSSDDDEQPREGQRGLPGDAEVEKRGDADDDERAEQRPAQQPDPADHGDGDDVDAGRGREAVDGELGLPVADDGAAETGEGPGDRVGLQFAQRRGDGERPRGLLVVAQRGEQPAERAAAQVRRSATARGRASAARTGSSPWRPRGCSRPTRFRALRAPPSSQSLAQQERAGRQREREGGDGEGQPRSRSAGTPTATAASAAAAQPATTPRKKLPVARRPAPTPRAPMPANANWPRDSSPATPVTTTTDRPRG